MKEYSALYLFSGIGGGALGFQNAKQEHRGIKGEFKSICGIDVDPDVCKDFENITGSPGIQMDLFSRKDYIDFHGHEPLDNWREIGPADILKATKGIYPDVVFTSPPCKGFSGLLPEKSAKSAKYQALNNLTIRGIWLTLEAFKANLPGIILIENVPRIQSRGAKLLDEIKQLLRLYGYIVSDSTHDCGEIGALSQTRKRYLLIARNTKKIEPFIYEPEKYPLKTIGQTLGKLPMPDDPKAGPMHRMPRLQWKTWVRLALIPEGGDWRDLEKIEFEKYRIGYAPRNGSWRISEWDKPSTTITSATKGVGQSNGVAAIADPRVGGKGYSNKRKVLDWNKVATTVTGTADIQSGAQSIADPRTGFKEGTHRSIYRVVKWDNVGPTVTGAIGPSNGTISIQDVRIGCRPRSGTFGVMNWNEPGKTVIGSADVHAGTAAIADPRIPRDNDKGVFVIIAEDGTWHRPVTTYELAMIQGFPTNLINGKPFILVGNSDASWRERIGNAVPPAAAQGIAETILRAMLAHTKGDLMYATNTAIWVAPKTKDKAKEVSKIIM